MIRSPKMPEGVRVQGRSRTRPILPPTPETWRNPSRKRMRRLLSQSAPKMYDSPGPPLLFLTLSLSLSCGFHFLVVILWWYRIISMLIFICLFVFLLYCSHLVCFVSRFSLPTNTHTHILCWTMVYLRIFITAYAHNDV